MGINVHCLDCSGTFIAVLLLETDVFLAPLTRRQENSVSNSKTAIYVPEQFKQCKFIPKKVRQRKVRKTYVKFGTLSVNSCGHNTDYKFNSITFRSGGGRVVKLLAYGARGPRFDSRPCHSNFRDWLSPAFKSRYG